MDIDPVEYFKEWGFAESIVTQIVCQAKLNQLEFVLSYMGFVPALARPLDDPMFQQPLDYRRLLFEDVTQLERTNHRYRAGFQSFDPANFNFPETMIATTEVETAYVQKIIDARRTRARYRAWIQMGSFGTYGFEFGSLSADQRLVKIVLLPGGEASHFDYYTGEKIDIRNPFSDG